MFLPVHLDDDGRVEPEVADARAVAFRGEYSQPFPVHKTLARFRIHREVADTRCHQVLEEVRALRWRDLEVAEAGFDDHPDAVYLVPRDGQTQRRFARAEPADSYKNVGPIGCG